jgi:O-antigen biosynthesis protein
MNLSALQFKLNKVWGMYKQYGFRYAFVFLIEKTKKGWRNRNIGRTFYQSTVLSAQQIAEAKRTIEGFTSKPLISILMPVYNVDAIWLEKAIESVIRQIYPHWELCIADDGSTQPHVKSILAKYAGLDRRIKVVYRTESGNISEATNSALSIATGSYIGLLDNDDELSNNALYENAKRINADPSVDWLYSDEDKIDERNNHFNFDLKPAWSPELLFSYMYTCHFTVYRTSLVIKVGGFRKTYDGSQDYDLALRISAATHNIQHIPKVLYHWRTIAQSTASNPLAKKYAYEAGRKALEEHLNAIGQPAKVSVTERFGVYKTTFNIQDNPMVSIVIPSAGKYSNIRGRELNLLENCIDRVRSISTYQNIEFIVVDGNDVAYSVKEKLIQSGVQWVSCAQPFNFSERINLGVKQASGAYVLLLNDDTEPIESDWIEQLLGLAQQSQIGAVGAKLITAQHQIQHAGIVLYEGSPLHVSYGKPDVGQGYLNAYVANRNFLAVTAACLMVSKRKYDEIFGMDETFPVNFNDVDFCLKLHEKGYRNVFAAEAKLYHYESVTRKIGYKPQELVRFVKKWGHYAPALKDPYFNENLAAYPSLSS